MEKHLKCSRWVSSKHVVFIAVELNVFPTDPEQEQFPKLAVTSHTSI